MENLDIKLKTFRQKIKLSQLALAKKIGVPLVTYRNWELGASMPNFENKLKLQAVLAAMTSEQGGDNGK